MASVETMKKDIERSNEILTDVVCMCSETPGATREIIKCIIDNTIFIEGLKREEIFIPECNKKLFSESLKKFENDMDNFKKM